MFKRISVLLVVLLVALFFKPKAIAQTSSQPSLLISPTELSVSEGETFTTLIQMDTAGEQAGGVGIRLKFDPALIKATSITPLPLFPDYPTATFDNETGLIVISGVVQTAEQLYTGKGSIAEIQWQAVKTGKGDVTFLFEPNSTRDSNIAVLTGSGDALKYVNSLRIVVEENDDAVQLSPYQEASDQPELTAELETTDQNTTLVLQNGHRQTFTLPNTGLILFLFAISLAMNVYFLFKLREVRRQTIHKQFFESRHDDL